MQLPFHFPCAAFRTLRHPTHCIVICEAKRTEKESERTNERCGSSQRRKKYRTSTAIGKQFKGKFFSDGTADNKKWFACKKITLTAQVNTIICDPSRSNSKCRKKAMYMMSLCVMCAHLLLIFYVNVLYIFQNAGKKIEHLVGTQKYFLHGSVHRLHWYRAYYTLHIHTNTSEWMRQIC